MGRFTTLLACAVLAAGCAVAGPSFAPVPIEQTQAVIYVYRPYSFAGSLLHPQVTCDDQSARIDPGGYHAFVVRPGVVRCRSEVERRDVVELDIQPGSVNYIEEQIGWGMFLGHPHLYPIDADSAQHDIQSCCKEQP